MIFVINSASGSTDALFCCQKERKAPGNLSFAMFLRCFAMPAGHFNGEKTANFILCVFGLFAHFFLHLEADVKKSVKILNKLKNRRKSVDN